MSRRRGFFLLEGVTAYDDNRWRLDLDDSLPDSYSQRENFIISLTSRKEEQQTENPPFGMLFFLLFIVFTRIPVLLRE